MMKKIIALFTIMIFVFGVASSVSAAQLRTLNTSAIETSKDNAKDARQVVAKDNSSVVQYTTIGGVKVAQSSMLSQAGADWDQSVIAQWRVPEANVLVLDLAMGLTSQWSAQSRSEFTTLVIRGVNPDHANLVIGVGLTAVDGVIRAEQNVYSAFLADGISTSILKLERVSIEELKFLTKEAHDTIGLFLKEGEAIGVWRVSMQFVLHPNAASSNGGAQQINIRTGSDKTPAEQTREWLSLSKDIYQIFKGNYYK
jgi:hypothetical protein